MHNSINSENITNTLTRENDIATNEENE